MATPRCTSADVPTVSVTPSTSVPPRIAASSTRIMRSAATRSLTSPLDRIGRAGHPGVALGDLERADEAQLDSEPDTIGLLGAVGVDLDDPLEVPPHAGHAQLERKRD